VFWGIPVNMTTHLQGIKKLKDKLWRRNIDLSLRLNKKKYRQEENEKMKIPTFSSLIESTVNI
jgi:hypothetical protein